MTGTEKHDPTGRATNPALMWEILDWYRQSGVDVCLGETPVNRFTSGPGTSPSPRLAPAEISSKMQDASLSPHASFSPLVEPDPKSAPDGPVPEKSRARDGDKTIKSASNCQNLADLDHRLNLLEGCALSKRATQAVTGAGPAKARVMMVGKAPGREDDLTGVPFSGSPGALLDKMLAAISLDRSKVYLTHLVPWRPPGNRDPAPAEIALCQPYLLRRIELVNPDIVILLGELTRNVLVGEMVRPKQAFPKELAGRERTFFHMMPPDFLLRQPAQKRQAWQTLKRIYRYLQDENSPI